MDGKDDNGRSRRGSFRVLQGEVHGGVNRLGELQARGEILADQDVELRIGGTLGFATNMVALGGEHGWHSTDPSAKCQPPISCVG